MKWALAFLLWPLSAAAQESFVVDGTTYEVETGIAYRHTAFGRVKVAKLYDPEHVSRSYVIQDGTTYRVHPETGAKFATLDSFSTSFDAPSLLDLIGPDLIWTGFNLQSPSSPDIASFVELRRAILAGERECQDNCISPAEFAMRGTGSLEAFAVPPNFQSEVSKAAIETGLLHAQSGDTIRFESAFFISEGHPVSLIDFEASYMLEGPGIRVMLDDRRTPWVELKWGERPNWYPSELITVPTGVWFALTFEVFLDHVDGQVRLWLDHRLIIEGTGQTLPLADTIIDRLELGITATKGPTTRLYVDDVSFEMR